MNHFDLLNVQDRTVLITGGASGIGLATAELFLQLGANVTIVDNDDARLTLATAKLGSARVKAVYLDVRRAADCRTVVAAQEKLHMLITCAGIVRPDDSEFPQTNYQEIMDVNVLGTLNMVYAAKPIFIAQRFGTIVMVGSITASHGWQNRTAYCASKGAVEAAMRALALEFAPYGVRVNAIAPGLVWTPLMKEVVRAAENAEEAFRFRALQQALGRMLEPQEVARHIIFLASELSSGIVGCVLDASGGRLAGHVPDRARPGPLYAQAWQQAAQDIRV